MDPINDRPAWQDRARCRTEHFSIYETDLLPNFGARKPYARKLCTGCPVIDDCTREAILEDTRGVVRGGWPFPNDRQNSVKMRRDIARDMNLVVEVEAAIVAESVPTLCKNGAHEMTESNIFTGVDGNRRCAACKRENNEARAYQKSESLAVAA